MGLNKILFFGYRLQTQKENILFLNHEEKAKKAFVILHLHIYFRVKILNCSPLENSTWYKRRGEVHCLTYLSHINQQQWQCLFFTIYLVQNNLFR